MVGVSDRQSVNGLDIVDRIEKNMEQGFQSDAWTPGNVMTRWKDSLYKCLKCLVQRHRYAINASRLISPFPDSAF